MASLQKIAIAAGLAFSTFIGFSQESSAAVIDFESISIGSYSSFSSNGVTFSLLSGSNITVSNDSNGQYVLAAPGTHFLDNRYGAGDFLFSLNAPTNYFGLQIGATNSAQTLSAFDSSNNLLGTVSIPDQVSSSPYPYTGFYSLNFSGITKVTLTGNASDWIVVDNVTTSLPVPEPETYGMMLAGIGLMGIVTRRRKLNRV